MKKATVYQLRGKYLVHASSRTTDGVWIVWEPMLAVQANDAAGELGLAIEAALDGSRSGVPHPQDWKAVLAPLLALGGVRSWSAFCRSAACVEVEEEGGRVSLLPTRNLGAEGGFEPSLNSEVLTTRDDPERLGALALKALRVAK